VQSFQPAREQPPGTPELLQLARQAFGTDCVSWAGLRLSETAPPDWLLEHTLEGTRIDVGPMVRSDALRVQAPQLVERIDRDRLVNFEYVHPLALAGTLAEVIAAGGSCGRRPPTRLARDVARACADGLIEDHLGSVVILHSRVAWSGWFASDVWDRSWIVVESATRHVWLLCLTGGRPLRRS
jgi:hypothetical protein